MNFSVLSEREREREGGGAGGREGRERDREGGGGGDVCVCVRACVRVCVCVYFRVGGGGGGVSTTTINTVLRFPVDNSQTSEDLTKAKSERIVKGKQAPMAYALIQNPLTKARDSVLYL